MIYLTIYLWMCSKLHDNLTIYLRVCSKLRDLVDHLSMDVFQTTGFTWPFIYGCVSNYMIYLTIIYGCVSSCILYLNSIYGCFPNYMINLTINVRVCSKVHDLLDHISMDMFQTTLFTSPLFMDVFQTAWFTWLFIYGCVSNCLFYLTIYQWMCLKLYVVFNYLSIDAFQTTWFTWPFIYWCVPNYMIYLTV